MKVIWSLLGHSDSPFPFVDNGVFLDGRTKTLDVAGFKNNIKFESKVVVPKKKPFRTKTKNITGFSKKFSPLTITGGSQKRRPFNVSHLFGNNRKCMCGKNGCNHGIMTNPYRK